MFGFGGRDDEGKTFFERFIVHDHFKRPAQGVHTTTPGGTFTYFVEQIGFDEILAVSPAAALSCPCRLRCAGRRAAATRAASICRR